MHTPLTHASKLTSGNVGKGAEKAQREKQTLMRKLHWISIKIGNASFYSAVLTYWKYWIL